MDPLDKLHDIQLPEQIHAYPVAPGWWLLAATIIGLTIWLFIKIRQYRRLRDIKKQALKHIKCHPELPLDETIALLKWSALQYFPRLTIAKLYGMQFQQFLLQVLPVKHQLTFDELTRQSFANQYKTTSHAPAEKPLRDGALLWLNHALPPKSLAVREEQI